MLPPEPIASFANQGVIDAKLNGQGQVIVEEARRTGLALNIACALVEQESGGRNIFGCDAGAPFCHEPVTAAKIQQLLAHIDAGGASQGVGLTQLTWHTFIRDAQNLGGAHIPRNQCRVGFGLLAGYLKKYPYQRALASYNAGEGSWYVGVQNGYAGAVASKAAAWKQRLGQEEPDPGPDEPGGGGGSAGDTASKEVRDRAFRVFQVVRLASALYDPPYRYTGGRGGESFATCKANGVDCSGLFDVIFRTLKWKGNDPWGTVRISQLLKNKERYKPLKVYPPGTFIVNDNAVAWNSPATDNSHVAMIWGMPAADNRGQLIIHSRRADGVHFNETDIETHQWARYEVCGLLPGLD